MIDEIVINGARFINVPASMSILIDLGLSHNDAKAALEMYDSKTKSREAIRQRKMNYFMTSDPLFMEAIRKDAAGDIEGAQAARVQALQAVADIKAKYALPEVDA